MSDQTTSGERPPRMIERWFPVAAVDQAVGTPAGSGRSEKAIFTWFASRPIAQARAAVLTTLLPDDESLRPQVERAVRTGDRATLDQLAKVAIARYPPRRPVLLDVFSGRGIIPLEAARLGIVSVGIDLSPVATLAGKLLAEYPVQDWSAEPALPFGAAMGAADEAVQTQAFQATEPRLVADVRTLLAEIDRLVAERMEPYYPRNDAGEFPWGYLWAVTMPCDGCKRRFPLLGSLVLRHPNIKAGDVGQSLRIFGTEKGWSVQIIDGPPAQQPTYSSGDRGDGKKRKGKSAQCPLCQHTHPLETVKAKGKARQFQDELLAVADGGEGRRVFRLPTSAERAALAAVSIDGLGKIGPYSAVPDERIPLGNVHTLMASGYGYETFGELMCDRQTLLFVKTVQVIRDLREKLAAAGVSTEYLQALISYAAATLCRAIRYATRGARLRPHGSADGSKNNNQQIDHVFINESKINFQFDYFEAGPGDGAGTWSSVAASAVAALRKVCTEARGIPARLRATSATALPYRDASVDLIITDPPYYDMIEYADASDLFHVWLKRILFDLEPEHFGQEAQTRDGLQNKDDEIIVRRVHEPGRVRHDQEFYQRMLARAFEEARRVLRPDGHLVVVFGHSELNAWRRLLAALHDAGFVVTAAWPSRTKSANTGVASIKVTITIGCRVAKAGRPVATVAQVDREVADAVKARARRWQTEGLALPDQLMAAYGPAMEVWGRYASVLQTDGEAAPIDRYLLLARTAVRDAAALRIDEIPLESFDDLTRFALFWMRLYQRGTVPKSEAVFLAQADGVDLGDVRDGLLEESKAGFQLTLQPPKRLESSSKVFDVVRAMVAAWRAGGGEGVAEVLATAERSPGDEQVWAVVHELSHQLPSSDRDAVALAGIQRMAASIQRQVRGIQAVDGEPLQLPFDEP